MRSIRWKATLLTVIASMLFPQTGPVSAQLTPIPDDTLGEASSKISPAPGFPIDVIEGGLRQGDALFHSFEAFHVDANQAVYFDDPGVGSILSRVTGGSESQILGFLGVLGDADLFLINPNGIIFGENARLSLQGGSFFATTADSVGFGDDVWFDTRNPDVPTAPLLTVQPSVFLFNQANPAAIVNNTRTTSQVSPEGLVFGGLRVADGESLTMLGGDVIMDNGGLAAFGGRVEIGGLAEPGRVSFNPDSGLSFPTGAQRSDVLITNGSRISVSDSTVSGGSIAITADLLDITNNSGISAGTIGETSFVESRAGDIALNARTIRVVSSDIDNIVRGIRGNSGDVLITADELLVSERSFVQSVLLGEGSTGKVRLDISDRLTMDNGFVFSNLGGGDRTTVATGNAGNIEITTPVLLLANSSQLQAGTFGRGDAGNVIINASERVVLERSDIFSDVFTNFAGSAAVGNGGNIQIETSSLSLSNLSSLSSRTRGRGDGGNIKVTAGSLSLFGESRLFTDSFGQGSAGNVSVEIQESAVFEQSRIVSALEQSVANTSPTDALSAGNIQITAGSLDLLDGSQLQSTTNGRGNAGNVTIRVRDRISIEGVNPAIPSIASTIFAITKTDAQGLGGNVRLTADSVRLADNGLISTTTSNEFAGGNVTVEANTLDLTGGGRILTLTGGSGRAGDIDLDITDRTTLTGENTFKFDSNDLFFSGFFASTREGSSGNGGTVRLSTSELQVLDQARIEVDSQGSGVAGNMEIEADTVRLDNGRLTAETAAVNGGNIALENVDFLRLRNGSLISTTAGTAGAGGNGGNIDIESNIIFSVPNENNDIRANAFSGSGGRVRIDSSGLFGIAAQPQDNPLTNDITASSQQGIQGTVDIETPETDPRSGLTELPVTFADASNQITQTCSGNRAGQDSEFVVTGRGGLPPSPIDALVGDAPLSYWAVLEEATEENLESTTLDVLPDAAPSTAGRLVEAQGWLREDGHVKLVAPEAPTNVAQTAMAC